MIWLQWVCVWGVGRVGGSRNKPNDTLMSLATDLNQVKPVSTGRFTVGEEIKETSLFWQKWDCYAIINRKLWEDIGCEWSEACNPKNRCITKERNVILASRYLGQSGFLFVKLKKSCLHKPCTTIYEDAVLSGLDNKQHCNDSVLCSNSWKVSRLTHAMFSFLCEMNNVEHQRKTTTSEASMTHECFFFSPPASVNPVVNPSYKTAWAQTLSLFTESKREAYVLIRFWHGVSILECPKSRPGQPSSLPPYSFKSTSLAHPSAETMIASLIFGNSLNLSNPWFWNISAAAAGLPD